VRKLAERSQTAAQEISSLTSSSVRVAEHSGELLRNLVHSIRKTSELVQEVATASREQSAGVAQVNQAMSRVDQVTQINASAAEELSSTAEEMASQADSLQTLMALFRINPSQDRPRVPRPQKIGGQVLGNRQKRDNSRMTPRGKITEQKINGAVGLPLIGDQEFRRF
ncbi:MAG TPA: methyl-accepting chemotaxis protein, partial [Candidatus Binatia bacterium]|nr:methyl-accepting chemotaxis protein [Candidatus Binatia bacterium]